jgi:cold shock CspA family protein
MAAQKLRKFSGIVIKWRPERAHGFVHVDGLNRYCFFHLSEFEEPTGGDQIKLRDRLWFYIVDLPKGLSAIRIVRE